MDVLRASAADVRADLAKDWPFRDATFDTVVANHVLEHVPDVVHVVEQAFRVLKPGGRFIVRGPHFSSPELVWADPTHRRGLSISMFRYFSADSGHPYARADFRLARARLNCDGARSSAQLQRWFRPALRLAWSGYESWANADEPSQQRAERLVSRFLPFSEVEVELEAIKR